MQTSVDKWVKQHQPKLNYKCISFNYFYWLQYLQLHVLQLAAAAARNKLPTAAGQSFPSSFGHNNNDDVRVSDALSEFNYFAMTTRQTATAEPPDPPKPPSRRATQPDMVTKIYLACKVGNSAAAAAAVNDGCG